MNQSNSYIEECLRLIETKWQRGSREDWSSYDFEKLNTAIFDATGVTLSVSTLKRLFGKVSYPNLPSVHTLNTLARFAGFEDWNDFRQHHPLPATTPQPNYGEFATINFEHTGTPPGALLRTLAAAPARPARRPISPKPRTPAPHPLVARAIAPPRRTLLFAAQFPQPPPPSG